MKHNVRRKRAGRHSEFSVNNDFRGAIVSKKDRHIIESSGNVFADLGFEPHEAENLLVRARLMAAIKAYIESEGITQREAQNASTWPSPVSVKFTREKSSYFLPTS